MKLAMPKGEVRPPFKRRPFRSLDILVNTKRVVVLLALASALAGYLSIGHFLSRPATQAIGSAPSSLQAQDVEFTTSRGARVAGWFAAGRPHGGVVLLLHGVRSNRLQMVRRAQLLHAAGYGVLLIDLPAHGMSEGSRITFGANESLAVTAAIDFLREQDPDEKVGVIGASLGAASAVLAKPAGRVDALVLEAMYPTIDEAVADRLEIRLGPIGRMVAPALLWQLPVYAGIGADALRPEDGMKGLAVPRSGTSADMGTRASLVLLSRRDAQSRMAVGVPPGRGQNARGDRRTSPGL